SLRCRSWSEGSVPSSSEPIFAARSSQSLVAIMSDSTILPVRLRRWLAAFVRPRGFEMLSKFAVEEIRRFEQARLYQIDVERQTSRNFLVREMLPVAQFDDRAQRLGQFRLRLCDGFLKFEDAEAPGI